MKIYLNIPYEEKDEVKQLAKEHDDSIHWDKEKKLWYWQGNGPLPAFLAPYHHLTNQLATATTASKQEFYFPLISKKEPSENQNISKMNLTPTSPIPVREYTKNNYGKGITLRIFGSRALGSV